MLHPAIRHTVFVHRFVEAVTWQPLRKALTPRPLARTASLPADSQLPSSSPAVVVLSRAA